ILAVARRADPGPWLDRFRDPAVRAQAGEVARLAGEADPAALPAGTLIALAELMRGRGLDPKGLLRAGQLVHPDDFLIPFSIAVGYGDPQRLPRESAIEVLGYYRTCRTLRPENLAVLINLGNSHRAIKDIDGAIACYREATRINPGFARAHHCLGLTLLQRG